MKTTFLIVIVVAFAGRLFAQGSPAQPVSDRDIYLKAYEKYKRMHNGGVVMIVVGGIAAFAGVVMISSANYTTDPYTGQRTTTDPAATAGALMVIGSTGFLGAGIPLTIVGGHQMKKYKRKLDGVTLKLNLKPQQTGLTLAYKF
jgi:hypothetical protein